jgi:hypothetical protein
LGRVILGDAPINKIGGIAFLDFNLNPELAIMVVQMKRIIQEF